MTVKGCSSRSLCCPAAPRPCHMQLNLAWRSKETAPHLQGIPAPCSLLAESVHVLGGNKDGCDMARSVKMSF